MRDRRSGQTGRHGSGRDGRPHVRRIAGGGEAQPRSAGGTGDGFGVEAAARRIGILRGAGRAEGEGRHRGVRPIIGKPRDQRVARPALRAADERVAVSAIGRVVHLGEACIAGEAVGGDVDVGRSGGIAVQDGEAGQRFGCDRLQREQVRVGERRSLFGQRGREAVQRGRCALCEDLHLPRSIAHPADEPFPGRDPPHEGAEADALHAAGHHHPPRHAGPDLRRRIHLHGRRPAWCRIGGQPRPDQGAARLQRNHRHAATRDRRTPPAHQMRQAPSSETMHGPTGARGVQARP